MINGLVFNIQRFCTDDGEGIRTTVFLKGCPLKCLWCHNPESHRFDSEIFFDKSTCIGCALCIDACKHKCHTIGGGEHFYLRDGCTSCGACARICPTGALSTVGKRYTVAEIIAEVNKDKEYYGKNGGITLSGGEPLAQPEFALALAKEAKASGLNACIETSCFCNKNVLDKISDYIDFFLCDLKAYDENVHKCLTGVSNKIILENLRHLDAIGKNIEVRIPYVPGFNDSEMEKIANFIKDMKSIRSVRIMPFHKYAASKYKALGIKNTMPDNTPTDEDIHRMQELIKSITGFAVV